MSLHDYQESQRISAQDPPFYALIVIDFRKADSDNYEKLRQAFPLTWRELIKHYYALGGLLKDELPESHPPTLALGSFNDPDHRKKEPSAVDTHHSDAQLEKLMFDLNQEELDGA